MRNFTLLIALAAVLTACTVRLDDTLLEKETEKNFPPEAVTQTNTVVLTNTTQASSTVVTNYIYNVSVVTNYLIVSNFQMSGGAVTNTEYITNTVYTYEAVTNTRLVTNFLQVLVTNTILSNVDNTISVLLYSPLDQAYLADVFTVSGYSPDAGNLAGAMIYLESTNNVMVQAQYSSYSGNSFTTTLSVNKEGHYYLWASAWDDGDAIGKTQKRYIVADWSAPQLNINTPDNLSVEGGLFLLQGSAYDRISGIQGVYLSIDGSAFTEVSGREEWYAELNLTPGVHQLTVYCRDKAGYVSLSQTLQVLVESQ